VSKISRRPVVPAPVTSGEKPIAEKPSVAPTPKPSAPKDGWKPPEKSLGSAVNDATESLVTNSTLVSPPSAFTKPTPGTAGTATTPSAHGVSVTGTRVNGGQSESLGAEVSRATLTVSGNRTEAGRDVSGSVALAKDYLGITGGTTSGNHSASGNIAFSSSSLSAGFDLTHGNTQRTGALGVLGTVSGDRKVSDLGPTEGGRRVELSTSRGEGVWLTAGIASPALAAGAYLSLDRSREVTYATTIPDDAAKRELLSGNALSRFADNTLKAFGLKADALKPPPLDQPEKLKVGDELKVAMRGSVTGGLALGAVGMRAGVQASVKGDFELSVKKLSATQVEVTVTPTQVRALQAFLDTPSPLEVDVTKVRARSLSQGFIFDLSKPEAKAAFEAAITGKLPNALGGLKSASPADAGKLVELARSEPMPPGVQRTFLEGTETTATSAGAGLDFGILERLSGIAGLSARTTQVSEDRARTDGTHAVVEHSRGIEKRREVLLSGTEGVQVTGSVRTQLLFDFAGPAASSFEGLTLTASISDSKVRGDELNDDIIDTLNEKLGLSLPHVERDGRNLSRAVKVEFALSAKDLAALAKARPEDEEGMLLVEGLQDQGPTEQAEAVRDYVAHGGLKALGQIREWANIPTAEMGITTESAAYSKSSDAVKTLGLEYDQPIALSDGAKAITRRFEEVSTALRKLNESWLDAVEDPFLDGKTRPGVRTALEANEKALQQLISVAHLKPDERLALRDQLDSGWVTAAESRLMEHLDQSAVA
jgi:hypothetical protein